MPIKITKSLKFIVLLLVTGLALTPLVASEYYLSLLINILGWTALAISWQFFSGNTKYISLGSAAFFGIGFYTTAIFGKSLPFFIVEILGGILCFLFSVCVGLVTLRLKGMYFAIFTFGLTELLKQTLIWWETMVCGIAGRFVIYFETSTVYYIMLLLASITILSATLLRRSKLGLALKAIGECEDAAIHLGVNSSWYKTFGFAISSLFMALVGGCFATRWTYVDPRMCFDSYYSFMPAIMTLLGGIDFAYGPIVGSIILSILSEVLITSFRQYYMIILGATLLIIVLFLPKGLVGIIGKSGY